MTIKPLKVCLHGKPCPAIYVENSRQMCGVVKQPIFDMTECPRGYWAGCCMMTNKAGSLHKNLTDSLTNEGE